MNAKQLLFTTACLMLFVACCGCQNNPLNEHRPRGDGSAMPPPSREGEDRVDQLTAEELNAFIKKFSRACGEKDLAFLQEHFEKDAVISIDRSGLTVKESRDQYLRSMTANWERVSRYEHSFTEPVIVISDDQAGVQLTTIESGEALGRAVRSETDTSLELKLQDGRIMVHSLSGKMKIAID